MLLRCYGGELVMLTDITGGTGAMGGGMQREVMVLSGAPLVQCASWGLSGFGSPAEGTAFLGVTRSSAQCSRPGQGPPPIPSSHHRSPLPG